MRVLIVEDEQPLGEVFRDFLAELGHDAIVVRTAAVAPLDGIDHGEIGGGRVSRHIGFASGVGGVREVVRDRVTGLLVPPGDPSALAGGRGPVHFPRIQGGDVAGYVSAVGPGISSRALASSSGVPNGSVAPLTKSVGTRRSGR